VTADHRSAALMDRIYRRQRHVYDVTRKYFLLGRDRLIEQLKPSSGDSVLEIGCGTGRNLILAARRYPDARLFGIDISWEMLATAGNAIARAGLSSRVRLARADATAFDPADLFGEARFARVFMSYSLSMIPAWGRALEQAIALLVADGEIHVVDFGGQEQLPAWFRAGLRLWLARFHVTPRDDLERVLTTLADSAGAALVLERPYGGYAQYAIVRRLSGATTTWTPAGGASACPGEVGPVRRSRTSGAR